MSTLKICDRCGTKFDPEEAEDTFEIEYALSYSNFKECLCADCAGAAIDTEEEDSYFEICENCGKEYNPFVAISEFDIRRPSWCCDGYSEYADGDLLCGDCVYERWEEAQGNDESDEDLSVYDAALIWASNGKDEDYMFGYSEEELEDAL